MLIAIAFLLFVFAGIKATFAILSFADSDRSLGVLLGLGALISIMMGMLALIVPSPAIAAATVAWLCYSVFHAIIQLLLEHF